MRKLFKKLSAQSGFEPGTLVHIGERKMQETRITRIAYDAAHVELHELRATEATLPPQNQAGVTWINVDGLHEVELLGKLGEQFGLHPLVVEDILNTTQRPKLEDYEQYLFVVLKSFYHVDEESDELEIEQISLVLGPNYVLSFQEREGDEFDPVRDRIRANVGRICKTGADYLAYALVDLIVDRYFAVLEQFGDRIETLEEELVADPTTEILHAIHHLKREMAFLRRSVWPLRELIGGLERSESPLIDDATRWYLRDVYDHTIQVIDAVEAFRDTLSGMLDIYLSSVSNRMNQVMKVLTIIATVFIPLTFIAGVYGMNFRYMPELNWPWGYPLIWGIMIAIAMAMVYYFYNKKWL
ncbi:MAG: magnesium/cobalt transporter CorA [Anaerolineae bacterium]|nr:magnesium/cobalt transporter CorA [Anaerolineae bacterium]